MQDERKTTEELTLMYRAYVDFLQAVTGIRKGPGTSENPTPTPRPAVRQRPQLVRSA